jgi:hypothetical protein
MQKLRWLPLILAFVIACDDDESPTDISGTYVFFHARTNDCDDEGDNETEEDNNGCDDGECGTIVFTSDGNFTSNSFDGGVLVFTEGGTYTVDGTKITISCSCDFYQNKDAVFELHDNELWISGNLSLPGCKFVDKYRKL